jgi:hypothetical protein
LIDSETVCSICQEAISECSRSGRGVSLPCNDTHVFHEACIKRWFVSDRKKSPKRRESQSASMQSSYAPQTASLLRFSSPSPSSMTASNNGSTSNARRVDDNDDGEDWANDDDSFINARCPNCRTHLCGEATSTMVMTSESLHRITTVKRLLTQRASMFRQMEKIVDMDDDNTSNKDDGWIRVEWRSTSPTYIPLVPQVVSIQAHQNAQHHQHASPQGPLLSGPFDFDYRQSPTRLRPGGVEMGRFLSSSASPPPRSIGRSITPERDSTLCAKR